MTDTLISLRLGASTLDRADALKAPLKKAAGAGVGQVTRSYVLRVALEEGLKVLEKRHSGSRRREGK